MCISTELPYELELSFFFKSLFPVNISLLFCQAPTLLPRSGEYLTVWHCLSFPPPVSAAFGWRSSSCKKRTHTVLTHPIHKSHFVQPQMQTSVKLFTATPRPLPKIFYTEMWLNNERTGWLINQNGLLLPYPEQTALGLGDSLNK